MSRTHTQEDVQDERINPFLESKSQQFTEIDPMIRGRAASTQKGLNLTIWKALYCLYIYICVNIYQDVPHKAVGRSFKIGNLSERFVVVSHGWQSKFTDESKSGWRQRSVVGVLLVVAMKL